MEESHTLAWEDLEPAAQLVFDVWTDQPELAWARTSWAIMADAGLTDAPDPVTLVRVSARFVALCRIYRHFCHAAWEEDDGEYDMGHWTSVLRLSAFRVGQAVGADPAIENATDADGAKDAELVEVALRVLSEQEHQRVLDTLLAGYGSESELFVSLWLSRDARWSGRRRYSDEVLEEVLNGDLSTDKQAGFSWLTGGALVG